MTECIWAAVFAFLIGWLFVNQRRGNRRMSEQLGLPLTYRTDGMEGIDDVSLTVTNGGDNLRLRWLVTNTTNAPISVRDPLSTVLIDDMRREGPKGEGVRL